MEASAMGASGSGLKITREPMIVQICNAIKILKKPKVGASYAAIRKYILNTYEDSSQDTVILEIKKAILMGEQSGILIRPPHCKKSSGCTGSFIINVDYLDENLQLENEVQVLEDAKGIENKTELLKSRKVGGVLKNNENTHEVQMKQIPQESSEEFEEEQPPVRRTKKVLKKTKVKEKNTKVATSKNQKKRKDDLDVDDRDPNNSEFEEEGIKRGGNFRGSFQFFGKNQIFYHDKFNCRK